MRWQSDMIRRVYLVLAGVLLAVGLLCSAQAQLQNKWIGGRPLLLEPVAAAYFGPGNIASASMWAGFRGYTAAFAGNAANICLPSAGACFDATIAGGNLVIPAGLSTCNNSTVICTVKKLYDQTGNTNCTAAVCDLIQNTEANRPTFVLNCQNSHPCMATTASQCLETATAPSQVQPVTMVVAVKPTTLNAGAPFASDNNSFTGTVIQAASPNWKATAGTVITGAAGTAGALQVVQFVANGASSSLNVDSATTGAVAGGAQNPLFDIALGCQAANSGNVPGSYLEAGIWASAFTTNLSLMNSNIHAYWNF